MTSRSASAKPRSRLTEGPVRGHLLRLMLPMCAGIFATMTTGLVDAFWLGRLGTTPLAAVSFVVPFTMMVFSIAIGLGAGASSLVARAAGRNDEAGVRRLATDALLLCFLVMSMIAIIGVLTIRPLFGALGAKGSLLDEIETYLSIWYFGIIFVVGPMIANNVLRALGNAIAPSLVMVSIAVINLVLDPFLIFGWGPFPRLEVAGAAIATLIANAVAFLAAGWLLIRREHVLELKPVPLAVIAASWRQLTRIGLPAAASNMINPLATTAIIATVARYGEAAIAGFGVAQRVEVLAIIPMFALSASIGPVTGQNSGAGQTVRVRESFVEAFRICVLWGGMIAIAFAVLRHPISALFTTDEAAREVIRLYLIIVPISIAGYGITIAMSAGFNGLGRPLIGMTAAFARSLLLYAPLAILGAQIADMAGLFSGMALANILAGLVIVYHTLCRAFPAPQSDPH
jgi:putative MATE family efflux protein